VEPAQGPGGAAGVSAAVRPVQPRVWIASLLSASSRLAWFELQCHCTAFSRCKRLSHSAQADANITCHGTGRRLDGSMTTSSQAVLTTACRTRSVPTTFERFPALRSERDQIAYHHKTSHQGLTPLLRISRARGQVWKQQGTALSHYAGHLQSEGKVWVKRCTAAQRHMA
jgi:hypothetical protein